LRSDYEVRGKRGGESREREQEKTGDRGSKPGRVWLKAAVTVR